MKLSFVFVLSAAFAIFACTKSDSERFEEVSIRVANLSAEFFEDTTFNGVNYGDLAPGEVSAYRVFSGAYHYGSVSITIDGENYGWIPIDFVGETPLKRGNYTFEYRFDASQKLLSDTLVQD